MQVLNQLGASFFPATAVTDFVTSVTTVLTDNIAVVLGIFGFTFGLGFIRRMVNKSAHGKI